MGGVQWKRILVVAPHPDDESLAAGGLIVRARRAGADVRVIYLTDGESNGLPQRYIERRLIIRNADRERWAARRQSEAISALNVLGIRPDSAIFTHLPDGGLHALDGDVRRSAISTIATEIARFAPDLILSPCHNDLHGDHRAASRLLQSAVSFLGESAPQFEELAYLVHGRPWGNRVALHVELDETDRAVKRAAIECHASQLALGRARFMAHASRQETFYVPSSAATRRHLIVARAAEVAVACWLFVVSN